MPVPSEQSHGRAGYGAHPGHAAPGAHAAHGAHGPSSGGDGGAGDGIGRRRSPARIIGRALLVLAIVAALAGTTAWGFVNRASAEKWRDRSLAADEDLATSLDRIEVTEDQLEDARQRLRDLASEKAGETDRNRVLADVVAQAPEVTAALADCQQQTTDLANDIIAAFNDPDADVAALQARTDDVNEVCADALDAAEELEETIDGLGI